MPAAPDRRRTCPSHVPAARDLTLGVEELLLLQEEFILSNPKWHKELEAMVKSKVKAEIQALSSFGFQYLSKEYLPRKLKEADWI